MPSCPSCSHDLPDMVTKDHMETTLKERIGPKNKLIARYEQEIATAQSERTTLQEQLDGWKAKAEEYGGQVQAAERESMWGQFGINDADTRETLELVHQAKGGDTSLADWLAAEDGARANPLFGRLFAAGDAGQPAPNGAPPPPPKPGPSTPPPPRLRGQGDPPGPQGRMSAQQLERYFESPEYQGLEPAAKRAKFQELVHQFQQPEATA